MQKKKKCIAIIIVGVCSAPFLPYGDDPILSLFTMLIGFSVLIASIVLLLEQRKEKKIKQQKLEAAAVEKAFQENNRGKVIEK